MPLKRKGREGEREGEGESERERERERGAKHYRGKESRAGEKKKNGP